MEIETLNRAHHLDVFCSRNHILNHWLQTHALSNHRNGSCRTFVAVEEDKIAGFYALAAGSVAHEGAPPRVTKGLARHPVPVAILARIAVDQAYEGQGIGSHLFRDAVCSVIRVADTIGIRALLIHAKNEDARNWYRTKFGLQPSPIDSLQFLILMKDLRKMLQTS